MLIRTTTFIGHLIDKILVPCQFLLNEYQIRNQFFQNLGIHYFQVESHGVSFTYRLKSTCFIHVNFYKSSQFVKSQTLVWLFLCCLNVLMAIGILLFSKSVTLSIQILIKLKKYVIYFAYLNLHLIIIIQLQLYINCYRNFVYTFCW